MSSAVRKTNAPRRPGPACPAAGLDAVCIAIADYLKRAQDFTPGDYYGSFWSEKAYHGPRLDYHAGGSHHHRGAGSGGLALWLEGRRRGNPDLLRRAELAFDWLAARQRPGGGYFEIQNNEKPSDWEHTGLEECSTIALAFAAHGLGEALAGGLPPKTSYRDCLLKAGHWLLAAERPAGSGRFPHHDRSPYDCLNANLHAAESLALIHAVLRTVYGRPLDIFYQGARRAVAHTLALQAPDGSFPYRAEGGVTINYTALVLWCLLNILERLPAERRADFGPPARLRRALGRAAAFLRVAVGPEGRPRWDRFETSSARHNLWTYAVTANVLQRLGGRRNLEAAGRLLKAMLRMRTPSGLLPMQDRGEPVTECAFMQADLFLFLDPFRGRPAG